MPATPDGAPGGVLGVANKRDGGKVSVFSAEGFGLDAGAPVAGLAVGAEPVSR